LKVKYTKISSSSITVKWLASRTDDDDDDDDDITK